MNIGPPYFSFINIGCLFYHLFGVRAELRVCDEFKIKYAEGRVCVCRSYVGCLLGNAGWYSEA